MTDVASVWYRRLALVTSAKADVVPFVLFGGYLMSRPACMQDYCRSTGNQLISLSHIVESCPLTKLNGGLSRLHSADEDAVSWLTNYGKWHAYEKKIETQWYDWADQSEELVYFWADQSEELVYFWADQSEELVYFWWRSVPRYGFWITLPLPLPLHNRGF